MTAVGPTRDRDVETFNIRISEDGRVHAEWQPGGGGPPHRETGELHYNKLTMRTVDVLVDLLRRNKLQRAEELKVLGDLLFTTLCGLPKEDGYVSAEGPGRLLYEAMRAQRNADRKRLLRVSLEIEDSHKNAPLVGWPWEYLHIPAGNYLFNNKFIGEHTSLMLSRKMPLRGQRLTDEIGPPLRVLFVVLAPDTAEPGHPALPSIEYESLKENLFDVAGGENAGRIDIQTLTPHHDLHGNPSETGEGTTNFETFAYRVGQWEPHVVHIIAHGRHRYDEEDRCWGGEIAFREDGGRPQWIGQDDIANRLAEAGAELVFLQACESADAASNPYHAVSGMAQALAGCGVPAVLAMQYQVKQKMANKFARIFYERLLQRVPIEVAMHEGVQALAVGGAVGKFDRREFGMPVLYLGEDIRLLSAIGDYSTLPARAGSLRDPRAARIPAAPRESEENTYDDWPTREAERQRESTLKRGQSTALRPDHSFPGRST